MTEGSIAFGEPPHVHAGGPRLTLRRPRRSTAVVVAAVVAASLPLIGLASLLLRSRLDPQIENYRAHFVVFGVVGTVAYILGHTAGEAANRRGDARVLLLSLAFMATGGFLMIHAYGTPGVLFSEDYPGFKIAIPVGLLVSAIFAAASAFVNVRPGLGPWLMRRRRLLRALVLLTMAAWLVWTIAKLPPLHGPDSEAGRGTLLAAMAVVATGVYAASAAGYWKIFRHGRKLLPAAVVACFLLLSEAMIGVAVTGEREWHASWWEWHGLILVAYVVIAFAAHREWRDERFRHLYLPTTREREQEVSVLFGDLVGFTSFSERASPASVAAMLNAYWSVAAPLLTREHGGDLEKFIGDGIVATFNSRGDQPDHALRAARAALALQQEVSALVAAHPEWPPLRVGVNSGEAVLREVGGEGHVAYAVVGDTINTASRLESHAPPGGVLIGPETYERLPPGVVVEARRGLRMKGKAEAVHAYVLLALP
ncbi:MAG: adenylate/guanylate cyclase domain-containing protein [Pseudomonadota bacterium]